MVSPQSPTQGLTHLQFEAMLTAARDSSNPTDFALVCLLGLLGLRIFKATSLDMCDLGEEHGHRVVRVLAMAAKSHWSMPPAVARSADRSVAGRDEGPILLDYNGDRMTRQAATRSLHRLEKGSGVIVARMHPSTLRHTFVATMVDAGVDLRDTQIATRHAGPTTTMRYDRARANLDRQPNYMGEEALGASPSGGTVKLSQQRA